MSKCCILLQDSLRDLVKAGVVGFKCFLCPSGVDEFPNVGPRDLEKAFDALEGTGSVLAVRIYDLSIFKCNKIIIITFNNPIRGIDIFLESRFYSVFNLSSLLLFALGLIRVLTLHIDNP